MALIRDSGPILRAHHERLPPCHELPGSPPRSYNPFRTAHGVESVQHFAKWGL